MGIKAPIEYATLITPDGLEYLFHDGSKRFLLSFSGQGAPGITFISQRAPYQHGETVNDYRLNPRNIAYTHRRNGCNRDDYWAIRRDMLNNFRINRQLPNTFRPFVLRYIVSSGETYDINVYPLAGPEFQARRLDAWDEASVSEALRWYAPDPIFFSPDATLVTLDLDICSDLEFPFEFPFEFCGSALSQISTLTYPGDWKSSPIVYFTGPFGATGNGQGVTLQQVTTGEKLQFITAIPAGLTIAVNTAPGVKSVLDDLGRDWIGALSDDSDLATFHVAPDPEAPAGVNSFSAFGIGGVSGLSQVRVEYLTRWYGF